MHILKSFYLFTVMFFSYSLFSMEIEKESNKTEINILDSKILQPAYDVIDKVEFINKKTMFELRKTLKTLAKANSESKIIKELLMGTDNNSKEFTNYLIKKLAPLIKLKRLLDSASFEIENGFKKEYLVAAYLGTPQALELFKKVDSREPVFKTSFILDAKLVKKSRPKYKYVPDPEYIPSAGLKYIQVHDGYEEVEVNEPIEKTLKKFPKTTREFLKEHFNLNTQE